jgi:hypothetical protein
VVLPASTWAMTPMLRSFLLFEFMEDPWEAEVGSRDFRAPVVVSQPPAGSASG